MPKAIASPSLLSLQILYHSSTAPSSWDQLYRRDAIHDTLFHALAQRLIPFIKKLFYISINRKRRTCYRWNMIPIFDINCDGYCVHTFLFADILPILPLKYISCLFFLLLVSTHHALLNPLLYVSCPLMSPYVPFISRI